MNTLTSAPSALTRQRARDEICARQVTWGTPRYVLTLLVASVCLVAASAGAVQLASPAPDQSSKSLSTPGATSPATPSSAEEDIRGLRPPYHIANPWLWAAYAGGSLALLALGFGAWRWLRRGTVAPRLTLQEATLRKLEETRGMMQPERARDFSIAVSEIVRDYVQQRFAVSAPQFTTWEFLHYLTARTDSPLAGYRPLLGRFLYHCDAAKFARWILAASDMEEMLQSACRFVQETGVEANPQGESSDHAIERSRSSSAQRPETAPAASVAKVGASSR